jgi:hypothetical protein
MTSNVAMIGAASGSFVAQSGNSYIPDSSGNILVPVGQDVADMLREGFTPLVVNPLANFRNLLDGGDFTTNPFQRNIAGLASGGVLTTAIANTPGYFADRWFGVGASTSAILFAAVADTSVAGFSQCLKFQRKGTNADNNPISMGQVLETLDSVRCQNQKVTLSFWAKTGANYSGGALSAAVVSGTGTNQSAANLQAGTWTGASNVVGATQPLSAAFVRYQFTGTVPAGCTQLGVLFAFTPSGTAGADDSISFHGVQLEIGAQASVFEHRDAQVELEIAQRYAWVIAEPAASVVVGAGMVSAANTEIFYLATPVQMLKAPAITTSAGTFKSNSATGGVVAATGLTGNATHTPNAIGLTATGTGTAGQGALLQGGGGSGYIIASADF